MLSLKSVRKSLWLYHQNLCKIWRLYTTLPPSHQHTHTHCYQHGISHHYLLPGSLQYPLNFIISKHNLLILSSIPTLLHPCHTGYLLPSNIPDLLLPLHWMFLLLRLLLPQISSYLNTLWCFLQIYLPNKSYSYHSYLNYNCSPIQSPHMHIYFLSCSFQ